MQIPGNTVKGNLCFPDCDSKVVLLTKSAASFVCTQVRII